MRVRRYLVLLGALIAMLAICTTGSASEPKITAGQGGANQQWMSRATVHGSSQAPHTDRGVRAAISSVNVTWNDGSIIYDFVRMTRDDTFNNPGSEDGEQHVQVGFIKSDPVTTLSAGIGDGCVATGSNCQQGDAALDGVLVEWYERTGGSDVFKTAYYAAGDLPSWLDIDNEDSVFAIKYIDATEGWRVLAFELVGSGSQCLDGGSPCGATNSWIEAGEGDGFDQGTAKIGVENVGSGEEDPVPEPFEHDVGFNEGLTGLGSFEVTLAANSSTWYPVSKIVRFYDNGDCYDDERNFESSFGFTSSGTPFNTSSTDMEVDACKANSYLDNARFAEYTGVANENPVAPGAVTNGFGTCNENPISGGGWWFSSDIQGTGFLLETSECQLTNLEAANSASYNSLNSVDAEVYIEITRVPVPETDFWLMSNCNCGIGGWTAYAIVARNENGENDRITLEKKPAGTLIGSANTDYELHEGDKLMLRTIPNSAVVEAWLFEYGYQRWTRIIKRH